MFNFTNSYIINSATDTLSGLPKWSSQAHQEDAGVVTVEGNMVIKRMGTFKHSAVKSIYRTVYSAGTEGQVVFTMQKGTYGTPAGTGSYMLDLYVRLTNDNLDSRFANDFVLKGMPFTFSIEVTDSDTTTDMATKFADQINRMGIEYGDMRLVASATGNQLTIKAGETDLKYNVLFERAYLRQYDGSAEFPVDRLYKEINQGVVTKPVLPFGDYQWMIRNVMLPTAENRQVWGVHEEDLPVVGGHYNQYFITICNRVGVQGADHVGDVVYAETYHSFYVLDSLATEFEAALKDIGVAIVDA